MNEHETGTDVTDQNIIDAQQVEIDQLEAQLKTVTAERDYSDVCGAQFEQEIRNLKKQLEDADYCGEVAVTRYQKAEAQLEDIHLGYGMASRKRMHDEIQSLKKQLEAVRDAIDPCLSVDELIAKIQAAIGGKDNG